MKNTRLQKRLLAAVATLALASSVSLAQPTNIFFQPTGTNTGGSNGGTGAGFTVPMGPAEWLSWYANFGGTSGNGITNYSISFDTNNPPPTSPTGATIGSVKSTTTWDGTNAGG